LSYEHTIRTPVACSGVGLHSGVHVDLKILPAPAGTGIVFRRTDLDGFQVEASIRNLARVSYATSLMKQGVLISTTEHLLSACIGIGVDNAYVDLNNLELPILDGSAQPFVEMILRAGLKPQRRKRSYIRIRQKIELRDGDKYIAVYPWDGYSVSYAINFPHPLIGKETFEIDISDIERTAAPEQNVYARELAPARTFGFLHEAQAMKNLGLIRGASEENAIVLTRDGIQNPPLRYSDEFVRHKVLDLIGDLALLGKRIIGRVVADRAGHAAHTALVSKIVRDHSLWEETTADELYAPTPGEPTAARPSA
jgi:UDP-3-O-[3-hydroxymyristoyl] N-acetylglucosamine deacetylase